VSIFGYNRFAGLANQFPLGVVYSPGPYLGIRFRNIGVSTDGFVNNTAVLTPATAVTDGVGFVSISRTASNITKIYKNGVLGTTSATVSTGIAAGAFQAGRQGTSSFSVMSVAAAGAGAALTDAENTNLYNRINTYLVAVGAA